MPTTSASTDGPWSGAPLPSKNSVTWSAAYERKVTVSPTPTPARSAASSLIVTSYAALGSAGRPAMIVSFGPSPIASPSAPEKKKPGLPSISRPTPAQVSAAAPCTPGISATRGRSSSTTPSIWSSVTSDPIVALTVQPSASIRRSRAVSARRAPANAASVMPPPTAISRAMPRRDARLRRHSPRTHGHRFT